MGPMFNRLKGIYEELDGDIWEMRNLEGVVQKILKEHPDLARYIPAFENIGKLKRQGIHTLH